MLFKKSIPKIICILFFLGFISFSIHQQNTKNRKYKRIYSMVPNSFDGDKFSGIEQIFKNTQYIGYYTDKDLTQNAPLKQFSQAQYVLAPLILDTDFEKHDFVLLDCTKPQVAMAKIQELGLIPLKQNNVGIILARKRP